MHGRAQPAHAFATCFRSSMDRIWVCGTHDPGSIPGESTNSKL